MISLLNMFPFHVPAPAVTMSRKYNNSLYCISHLYDGRNGEYICDAIEDTVRDMNHNGVLDNMEQKIYGRTAIPCGRYYVTFRKTGLLIGNKAKGHSIPYVHDVPHFSHIRIHNGESQENSEGCIILGYNKIKGKVTDSEDVCLSFYQRMKYRPFWLNIVDEF